MIDQPSTVRVGALDYAIKPWTKQAAANTGAYGLCDRGTCVILLREGLSDQKAAEVLLHEVVHAAYDGAGLSIGPAAEVEESVVNGLTYQLLQVIRDNPKLIAFLQQVFTKVDPMEIAAPLPPQRKRKTS